MSQRPVKMLRSPKFGIRFQTACEAHPLCPPLHRGRLTWLRDQLGGAGLDVSVESVRKWLSGEGRPSQDKAEALANLLGVDATWLYMGTGSSALDQNPARKQSLADTEQFGPMLPIAIRPNCVVQITGLPLDLSSSEATKISNIVLAHVSAVS